MTRREPRLDFEGLYRTHRNEVYRAALRKVGDHHEAEDVTQTAFLDAYKAVLRGSKPDLPRAWLLAIAENVRRRRFRTSLRRPREEPLREEALPSAEPPWRAQTEEIRTALASLAENQRKVFLLRELGGFSYGEIAGQLDISVPAVQMLLFRARQKLRAELGRSGSVRLGGLIPVPHWLLGLADRVPASFAVPRVAGLVAASVVAAGMGVTSDVSGAEPTAPQTKQGRAATQIASKVRGPVAKPPAKAVKSTIRAAAVAMQPTRQRQQQRQRAAVATQSAVSAVPKVVAVDNGSAEPAAPIAPPAILGISDPAPAPALVPALPPVSQAPIVTVVGALLPPLPEPPVEEGVPALPDIPIVVQPPLPPALPGGVEVTVPGLTSLQVGP
jgi:RNA polymerase sigma-70 factor (ECF subfamily)